MSAPDLFEILKQSASAASAKLCSAKNMQEALQIVIDLCEEKPNSILLLPEEGAQLGAHNEEADLPTRANRLLAAPDLNAQDYEFFKKLCDEKGYTLINKGIRNHLAGIDIAINQVPYAIAESGTCVMQTQSEECLISSGVSELNVLIVPRSGILSNLTQLTPILNKYMQEHKACYTSFITGPSRTADIELVLAVGVHGPLEVCIIVID